MEIREYNTYNELGILHLYASVGRIAYSDYPEVLRKGFENSILTLLQITRAIGFWVSFVQLAMDIPSCSRRTFWCSQSISGRALALRFYNLYWTDTAMRARSSWQRTTHRKPLLFTSQRASVKCP